MSKITLVVLLAVFVLTSLAQNIHNHATSQQSQPKSKSLTTSSSNPWIMIQGTDIPNYFVCGASLRIQSRYVSQPQNCTRICIRRFWRPRRCPIKCIPVPDKLESITTQGVKITFCHFQNWNDQKKLGIEGSAGQWLATKMCPPNQYVCGYQIQTSQNNRLGGLAVQCTNMYDPKVASRVVVHQSTGTWAPQVHFNSFAYGYIDQKNTNNQIESLLFQFGAAPLVSSFEITYGTVPELKPVAQTIDETVINNKAEFPITQEITLNKAKAVTRSLQCSEIHSHHAVVFNKYNTVPLLKQVGIPTLKANYVGSETTFTLSTSSNGQSLTSFSFGNAQTQQVSQNYKNSFTIPTCTRLIVKQVVYSQELEIPFTAKIGYTNGVKTQIETVEGTFRGTVVGNIEVVQESSKIC